MNDRDGPRRRRPIVPAGTPPSVLLADDNERNLFSLREALSGLEVEIVCAASGREALREVLHRDFAVILLDARMPDLDGYETAALIRKRERSEHIPLIFLTALDKEVTHIFRGYSAGAVDYVFKPVDPFILRSKVSVFLDLYRQAEKIRQQVIHARELLKENIRTRKANEEYLERLQHLSRQLMTLQDVERRNLAHELHDEIGQCLTALNLNLQMMTNYPRPAEATHSLVADSIEIVNTLVRQVRDLSLEMHPTMLEDFGVETTLNWYFNHLRERTGLTIDCHFELGEAGLSGEQSTACYRIVQGAFTNIVRHANATRVSVVLRVNADNELLLTVADNGVGFDQQRVSRMIQQGKSFGLIAMRERTFLVGGTIQIESEKGQGTVVRLRLPLRTAAKDRVSVRV